jgi:Tol biopolymer transport system component/regulation of enolase protein 1 (concanavalin A-like superfamily)
MLCCAAICFLALFGNISTAAVGQFEGQCDVGDACDIGIPGSAAFDAAKNEYRITASGYNMWFNRDAFYFLYNRLEGDLVMVADINFVGKGKVAHRKAGWIVRQTLDKDSPFIGAIVHGDGLIALQWRTTKGGNMSDDLEILRKTEKGSAIIMLERHADTYTLSVAPDGKTFQIVGSISLKLTDPVYAGLVVCSHDVNTAETAVFTNVKLEKQGVVKNMKERVIESTLETISVENGERKTVYHARERFEAPNWSRDGKALLFNNRSNGLIYTIPVEGGKPQLLDTGEANKCNNDHGLSPDGKFLAVSSQNNPDNKSRIYVLPSTGGTPHLVTPTGPSYWHGWSPDGNTLAYCAERNSEFDIYTVPVQGGVETRLTNAPGKDDGPDYSPDGKYIFFNSERTGVMKIWRMNADGTDQQQVTTDSEYADWFPHPSPDGKWLVFVSYDKTVTGHPEDKDVVLRIMPMGGKGKPKVLANLFGGQGTINVPSWSPDSLRIAFVSYRLLPPK